MKQQAGNSLQGQRRRKWIIFGVSLVALIFIFTTFGAALRSQQQAENQVSQQPLRANLGITYEKFSDKFNSSQYAKPAHLALPTAEKSSAVFQGQAGPGLIASGEIDAGTQKLLSFQLLSQPNNKEELVSFVTALGMTVETLHPDAPGKTRNEVLQELGFREGADLRQIDNSTTKGKITYRLQSDEKTGYVFSVKSAE